MKFEELDNMREKSLSGKEKQVHEFLTTIIIPKLMTKYADGENELRAYESSQNTFIRGLHFANTLALLNKMLANHEFITKYCSESKVYYDSDEDNDIIVTASVKKEKESKL